MDPQRRKGMEDLIAFLISNAADLKIRDYLLPYAEFLRDQSETERIQREIEKEKERDSLPALTIEEIPREPSPIRVKPTPKRQVVKEASRPGASQSQPACDPRSGTTPSEEESSMAEEWKELETELRRVARQSSVAFDEEAEAFAWWDHFVDQYGLEASDLVKNWPTIVKDRRQEVAALLRARRTRLAKIEEERKRRERERVKVRQAEEEASQALKKAYEAAAKAKAAHERAKADKMMAELRLEKEEEEARRKALAKD